jgi:hypothetical protein
MNAVVHIAGVDVQVSTPTGALLRQRCSWCGAVLVDYDLARIAVPTGQDPRPATWPVGALVAVDGPASWAEELTDGARLPAGSCALVDPEVTR